MSPENRRLDEKVVEFDAAAEPRPPEFSDEALALRFADRHADELRHVAKWNRWLEWDGHRWQFDDTLNTFHRARVVCREASASCNEKRMSQSVASAKTEAAVVSLARADRRLAATVDQWDADLWLSNTPDGTIDLITGDRRPHTSGDYITQMTAVSPGGACPTWKRFLADVTAGDAALQEFLARMCGYCLTGSTRDHALFFLFGTGANGKGVFINTISGILGDYHQTAPIETFTASSTDRHPTELAMLRGARLVTATETEEGRRWAEAKIKVLTGGDKITARFMRQDYFEFVPQFKLMISGNHKPGLRSVDEAIRRRFHLVPFSVTIPPDQRDDQLTERLKAEWPGIFQWMIDGCMDWQERGLAPPEAVTAATAAYLESEDAIAAWIDERCEHDPTASERSSDLYGSYRDWAEKTGEPALSQKKLSQTLENRGFQRGTGRDRRAFVGLRVLPTASYWDDRP
jgi:putative DNA primase/helicase